MLQKERWKYPWHYKQAEKPEVSLCTCKQAGQTQVFGQTVQKQAKKGKELEVCQICQMVNVPSCGFFNQANTLHTIMGYNR